MRCGKAGWRSCEIPSFFDLDQFAENAPADTMYMILLQTPGREPREPEFDLTPNNHDTFRAHQHPRSAGEVDSKLFCDVPFKLRTV